MDVNFQTM